MYVPKHDAVNDPEKLARFMERYSFALLVTTQHSVPVATHLPLLFDATRGEHGTLFGHIARANDQWQYLNGEALAIFHGPHAYISPTWYGEPGFVPTWNYAAVHAYGPVRLVDDIEQAKIILKRLVEKFEASFPAPWKIDPPDRFDTLAKAIVALEIPLTRVEGKWKLSGTHTVERQARVAAQLQHGDEAARQVAALMQENLPAK